VMKLVPVYLKVPHCLDVEIKDILYIHTYVLLCDPTRASFKHKAMMKVLSSKTDNTSNMIIYSNDVEMKRTVLDSCIPYATIGRLIQVHLKVSHCLKVEAKSSYIHFPSLTHKVPFKDKTVKEVLSSKVNNTLDAVTDSNDTMS